MKKDLEIFKRFFKSSNFTTPTEIQLSGISKEGFHSICEKIGVTIGGSAMMGLVSLVKDGKTLESNTEILELLNNIEV